VDGYVVADAYVEAERWGDVGHDRLNLRTVGGRHEGRVGIRDLAQPDNDLGREVVGPVSRGADEAVVEALEPADRQRLYGLVGEERLQLGGRGNRPVVEAGKADGAVVEVELLHGGIVHELRRACPQQAGGRIRHDRLVHQRGAVLRQGKALV